MAKQTTKQIETTTAPMLGTYRYAVLMTTAAVTGGETNLAQWREAGRAVSACQQFPTVDALIAAKIQYTADSILPGLSEDKRAALAAKLPRKGTDEYNALNEKGKAEWAATMKAKIKARATANTYFSRVRDYAFPPEKAESEPKAKRDLAARIAEELAKLVKVCESAESAPFDLPKEIAALKAALVIVAAKAS